MISNGTIISQPSYTRSKGSRSWPQALSSLGARTPAHLAPTPQAGRPEYSKGRYRLAIARAGPSTRDMPGRLPRWPTWPPTIRFEPEFSAGRSNLLENKTETFHTECLEFHGNSELENSLL